MALLGNLGPGAAAVHELVYPTCGWEVRGKVLLCAPWEPGDKGVLILLAQVWCVIAGYAMLWLPPALRYMVQPPTLP